MGIVCTVAPYLRADCCYIGSSHFLCNALGLQFLFDVRIACAKTYRFLCNAWPRIPGLRFLLGMRNACTKAYRFLCNVATKSQNLNNSQTTGSLLSSAQYQYLVRLLCVVVVVRRTVGATLSGFRASTGMQNTVIMCFSYVPYIMSWNKAFLAPKCFTRVSRKKRR